MHSMKSIANLALLALAFAVSPLALADSHEDPPTLASLWVLHAKSGHMPQLEEALKGYMAARAEAGDPRNWQAFQVIVGENLNTIGYRYCCFKWADQDAYDAWVMDTNLMQSYQSDVAPHVADVEHYFTELDLENSHWPEDSGPYSLFGVTNWKPKPNGYGQRTAAMSRFTATAKEHGWEGVWSWNSRIGGDDQLALVVPYQNWADMEPPEQTFYEFIAEHLGEEAAADLFEQFTSTFWSTSYTIFRHRPDLSMGEME